MAESNRVIAVGDIHGCAFALDALIERLQLTEDDTFIMLGDAIDRGPDSRGVIDRLLDLRQRCRVSCILGNHEQMLLDSLDGRMPQQEWLRFGGAETLDSYRAGGALDAVPIDHLDFIRSWGDYYETDSHFFAHGNYCEDLPLASQPWDEMRWIALDAYTPAPHQSGKTAVLGHTSNKQGKIVNLGHLVCIDTFCHGGGWLTALEANADRVWQSNQQAEYRTGKLPPVVDALR